MKFIFTILVFILLSVLVYPQMKNLHGDDSEYRIGLHSANKFKISFFNDGKFGGRLGYYYDPMEFGGEWPINSGHYYLSAGKPMIVAEVVDTTGKIIHLLSTTKMENISSIPERPIGRPDWWTFLPLPGFANPELGLCAMSEWSYSWPAYWPDISDPANPRYSPDGWSGAWNGYPGKDKFIADEESYFVADDYNNKMGTHFFPDTTDYSRKGLGLRMSVRSFQWKLSKAEDIFFTHFDFQNIGTYNHQKMVFGYSIENNMGQSSDGGDAGDDKAGYNRDIELVYMYDNDNMGAGNFIPVGYFGAALLETAGNDYDGIDNDNDGSGYPGPTISTGVFKPKTLTLNDNIVIINYSTYSRNVTTLLQELQKIGMNENDTLLIRDTVKFWNGKILEEIGDNLFDDNLNGLIDENRGTFDQNGVMHYVNIRDDGIGFKYIDYFTGSGSNNPLIDESRNDGIDNDDDWNPASGDVGADGNANTGDIGEGDGLPSPGEPNFDMTDVDETDMLGLTSFYLYDWGTTFPWNDEHMWMGTKPGTFTYTFASSNVELLFGSGYFRLKPGENQRLSVGIAMAYTLDELIDKKLYASWAYNNNYLLPSKPVTPVINGSTYARQVNLSWENRAEAIPDRASGLDFEGYKIYRSNDPLNFRETPLAQFDVINEYSGYSTIPGDSGYFWLGNNTGLQNTFVDTNVVYGYDYYYALTSYDHGNDELQMPPLESPANIYLTDDEKIFYNRNIIKIKPVDPAGINYLSNLKHVNGIGTGSITLETVDTKLLKPIHRYRIIFEDTTLGSGQNLSLTTRNISIIDLTENYTIINKRSLVNINEDYFVADGFRIALKNGAAKLEVNYDSSGWSKPNIVDFLFRPFSFMNTPVRLVNGDFIVQFGEPGIDTSIAFQRGVDLLPAKPVNFTILNQSNNQKLKFAFRERNGDDGKFTFGLANRRSDEIIIMESDTTPSWQINFTASSWEDTLMPGPGDFLKIKMSKPFLATDIYEFSTPSLTGIEDNEILSEFYLYQNYPNPFNPVTTINYHIAEAGLVTLKVFDILGREVRLLINEFKKAGGNSITFDASNLSSGVYFYELRTSNYISTKKMLLLK